MDLVKDEIEFNCNLPISINQLKPSNVLVKLVEEGYAKTKSGLILSATGSDKPDKLNIGRIIKKGESVSPCWKLGDMVAFSQYGGIKMPVQLMENDYNEYILTDDTSLFFSFSQQIQDDELKEILR